MGEGPSRLAALVFDDPYDGEEARAALHRMQGEGLLELDETALIVQGLDGKVRIFQDHNVVGDDQRVGHLASIVAAAVTGTVPFIMAGTLAGRLIGKLTDHGITNDFIKKVGAQLRPGTSALVILGRSDPWRRGQVAERLRQWNPRILQSEGLPPGLVEELQQSLRQQAAG
jgi:uncharacterized membrane protein